MESEVPIKSRGRDILDKREIKDRIYNGNSLYVLARVNGIYFVGLRVQSASKIILNPVFQLDPTKDPYLNPLTLASAGPGKIVLTPLLMGIFYGSNKEEFACPLDMNKWSNVFPEEKGKKK